MTAGGSGGGASHPAGDYLAGALAGSANIVVGFPADTVKVRLQNRLNPYSGAWHCATSIVKYEGVSAAGQRCMRKAGWVRRLWRPGVWRERLCRMPLARQQHWLHLVPHACCIQSFLPAGHAPRPQNTRCLQARALYRGMSPQLVGGAIETGVNYAVYQAMLSLTQGPRLALPEVVAVPLSAATAGCLLSFVLCPAEMVKVGGWLWVGGWEGRCLKGHMPCACMHACMRLFAGCIAGCAACC